MFEFDELERSEEARTTKSVVLHADFDTTTWQATSRSVDHLLCQGSVEVAQAVALFGPAIAVLPLIGHISGLDDSQQLSYACHPHRAARGGFMDKVDFETKLGQADPQMLAQEASLSDAALEKRLASLSDHELQREVLTLQDWRSRATGRLRTLERRVAWAVLGVAAGSMADKAAIRRAFKKRALELHPDKGGDAERFQLLQEMKDILDEPSEKNGDDCGEPGRPKKPGGKENRQRDSTKEKDANSESEDDHDGDISSDSSYDADEEFRKMFPKRKRKKKQKQDDDEIPNCSGDKDAVERSKLLVARRKLHQAVGETWERANRLTSELRHDSNSVVGSSAEPLRQLRAFLERFARQEFRESEKIDGKRAERIFRRFIEQGSELVCASAALDPPATLSAVAMQFNYKLLASAPSPASDMSGDARLWEEVRRSCTALLESIERLPSMLQRHAEPLVDQTVNPAVSKELFVRLLIASSTSGSGAPEGCLHADVTLPSRSRVADLRRAAQRSFAGRGELRLFCKGRFLAESSDPLSSFATPADASAEGVEVTPDLIVQCLQSNRVGLLRAEAAAVNGAVAVDKRATPSASDDGASQESSSRRMGGGAAGAHGAAFGYPGGGGDVVIMRESKVVAKLAAEQRAKEEVERRAAEVDAIDKHAQPPTPQAPQAAATASAKKAATAQPSLNMVTAAAPPSAEVAQTVAEESPSDLTSDDEELSPEKLAIWRQGYAEGVQKAQQGAIVVAKPSLPAPVAGAASKAPDADGSDDDFFDDFFAEKPTPKAKVAEPAAPGKPPVSSSSSSSSTALAKTADDANSQLGVRAGRTCWQLGWKHPCAGTRREDGSAILCFPCDAWIGLPEAFDHSAFERHCDKVGHYGWID